MGALGVRAGLGSSRVCRHRPAPPCWPGAAESPPLRTVVDIDDASLLAPGTPTDPMPDRVVALAAGSGEPVPEHRLALVRCVLDSLALAYRRHLRTAAAAGRPGARRRARRRRRLAEPAAVPAHRRRLRAPGAGRARRGRRAGQRAGPGPGAGRRPAGPAPRCASLVRRTHDLTDLRPAHRRRGRRRLGPAPRPGSTRMARSREGRPDGHLRQRRDVPRDREGGRDGCCAGSASTSSSRRRRPAARSRWSTPATSTRRCRWCDLRRRLRRATTRS